MWLPAVRVGSKVSLATALNSGLLFMRPVKVIRLYVTMGRAEGEYKEMRLTFLSMMIPQPDPYSTNCCPFSNPSPETNYIPLAGVLIAGVLLLYVWWAIKQAKRKR